ncbi:OmpA/MotB family protein [Stieleria varia]|uniref:Putative lipoprotein YiaD n=1 Tax=Stieleria varia TaxID=2528005 RepID=A0A5C6A556_9BACT|nr:OmpA family protein [Stieleria varia]TWT94500.1 putative lipoprotein YiaD precursor [Stieleria varia]
MFAPNQDTIATQPRHTRRFTTTWVRRTLSLCCLGVVVISAGCSQNPYLAVPGGGAWQAQTAAPVSPSYNQPALNPNDSRLAELNRRVQLLDDNNRQLHTQLAQSEQQAQVYRDELDLVRKQLAQTTTQLESTAIAARQAQSQVQGMQASTQMRGGASIQPNTNLTQLASRLNLGGLPVRQDGDTIRIGIPSDQLFQPGTAQLNASAAAVLDPVAAQLRSLFPRQRIRIEGYTDNGQMLGGQLNTPGHQLAAAQASAVLDLLTRRAGMPLQQFSIAAQGANGAIQPNTSAIGRAANRRIELVISPQTF